MRLRLGIPYHRLADETVTGFRYAGEAFLAGAARSPDVSEIHLLGAAPAPRLAALLGDRLIAHGDRAADCALDILCELEHDLHRPLALRGHRPRLPIALLTHGNRTGRSAFYAFYAPLLLAGLQRWDRVVCASRGARAALRAHVERAAAGLGIEPRFSVETIAWGVDTAELRPRPRLEARAALGLPARARLVLCHGRASLDNKQDLQPLLAVHRRLAARFPDVELVVSSTPSNAYLALVQARARQLGLARVRIVEGLPRAQVPLLYAASDVVVALSDTILESFGLAAVEAMACGVPVVAVDWPGFRDTVEHGVTGLLVPTLWSDDGADLDDLDAVAAGFGPALAAQSIAFDVDALEAALARVLADADLAARLGDAGRRRACAEYDIAVATARHVAMWREQLAVAATAPLAAPALAPPSMREAFAGYPSRFLDDAAVVALSEEGRAALAGQLPICIPAMRGQPIAEDIVAALFAALRDGPRTVAEVLERAGSARGARRNLGWMVKQGFVRLRP